MCEISHAIQIRQLLTCFLQIKHVIYLMMENHSFDNIAGYWDFRDDIDGLRSIEFCNE